MIKQRWLETLAQIVIGATFFVPLVLGASTFIFPFIVPKILAFRILAQVLTALYVLLLVCSWQRYEPKRSAISLSVAGFFLSFTLSTFLGVDWYHSFWDNHERMLGLFTLLHYGLFYLVATTVLRQDRVWNTLLKAFLCSGFLVIALAGIQTLDPQFLLNQGSGRVSSTLGNAIYLGGYSLFVCFCGLLLAVRSGKRFWRYIGYLAFPIGLLGIYWSGTRGSFIGLMAGMFVVLGWYLGSRWAERRIRRIAIAGLILLVGTMFALFIFRTTPTVQGLPFIGPLTRISLESGTAGTRLLAWRIAFTAFLERPIFGWGPNNFFYAFNQHYNPSSLLFGWGETWFDNAHNILVNTLAVQGMVGVVTYLSLFVTVWIILFKRYRTGQIPRTTASLFAGFFMAHLVQNVFVFENPTSYLYFFFMLAFVNGVTVKKLTPGAATIEKSVEGVVGMAPAMIVAVCVMFIVYVTNISPARANMATLKALQRIYGGQQGLAAFETVQRLPSPHIDDIRSDFARTVGEVVPSYIQAGRGEEAWAMVQTAFTELEKNRRLHPLDIRNHLQQADMAQIALNYFQQPQYMAPAREALLDALKKSPRRQQVIYQLVVFDLAFGKNDEAVKRLADSIADEPRVGEGWWRLAIVYQQIGQKEKAREVAREALGSGIHFDERGMQMLTSVLATSTPSDAGTAR